MEIFVWQQPVVPINNIATAMDYKEMSMLTFKAVTISCAAESLAAKLHSVTKCLLTTDHHQTDKKGGLFRSIFKPWLNNTSHHQIAFF